MKHHRWSLLWLAGLSACQLLAPRTDADPPPDPSRPYSHVGERVHVMRRQIEDMVGFRMGRPPSELIAKTEGHQAGDPVVVVVHGIMPVHASFDPLIAHLSRGAQVYYYQYDDTQDLDATARLLGEKLGAVLDEHPAASVDIVAHSMGGLISRRALTVGHPAGLAARNEQIRLVTIASPFGGFGGADFARLDMGIGADSWQDMGSTSQFVTQPGELGPNVTHVKLETDEAGKTRLDAGQPASDDAASLDQQRQPAVDRQASRTELLDLGHVGVLITADQTLPAETRAAVDSALHR